MASVGAGRIQHGRHRGGVSAGFVLFLAIPIPWSAPFGGLPIIGAVTALALWLFVLHILVLCGFRATVVFDQLLREVRGRRMPSCRTC